MPLGPTILTGDLLAQEVAVIVNAWNRNLIPWWLLWPQGVSGAIKKKAGSAPFRELARQGPIPLGGAVLTQAGRLPYRGIIHVAGIDLLWRASAASISTSVRSALRIVDEQRYPSVAFPVIGAGSGGFSVEAALDTMLEALAATPTGARVSIVRYPSARRR